MFQVYDTYVLYLMVDKKLYGKKVDIDTIDNSGVDFMGVTICRFLLACVQLFLSRL